MGKKPDARARVLEHLHATSHKHILAKLPALTERQAATLAAHPETRDALMQHFVKHCGDAELFHAWLKK